MNHSTLIDHNNSHRNHDIANDGEAAFSGYCLSDTNSNFNHTIEDEGYHAFIHSLVRIEEIVVDIITSNKSVFIHEVRQHERANLNNIPSPKYFCAVVNICNRTYPPDYEYSAYVELFFNCCTALKIENKDFNGYLDLKILFDLFNKLVTLIRSEGNKPEFIKKVSRNKEKSRRNYISASEYIDALFQYQDKRLLVLRIDFSYGQDYVNQTSVEQAKDDLEHFLNNRRGNKTIFNHWAGYLYKVEWGFQKGIHFHLVIFFKGFERWKDVYLAQEIGEYWIKITDGRGIYWNCNADKQRYEKLGIGMVRWDDSEKRQILLDNVISYLTKSEQYLRAKKLNKERCFVTGLKPGK